MSTIRSITRIEPAQFALIMGATYALIGIIMAVFTFLFMSFVPLPGLGGIGRGVGVIFFPVIYAILGYVIGFIGAVLYNLVAGTVGGIKVTVSE
jgi:transmembrane protein DUF3566